MDYGATCSDWAPGFGICANLATPSARSGVARHANRKPRATCSLRVGGLNDGARLSAATTRAANLLKVTKALQECPKSVSEICTETGVSGTTVSRLCKELRDSGGAYIAMYEQNRSTWAAVWSLGIGTDAKMPRRQTKQERREYVRQWKARQEIRRTSIDRFDLSEITGVS